MSQSSIDPGKIVDGMTGQVVGAVNGNLGEIATVAGGLIAVGVVWRFVSGMVGKRK